MESHKTAWSDLLESINSFPIHNPQLSRILLLKSYILPLRHEPDEPDNSGVPQVNQISSQEQGHTSALNEEHQLRLHDGAVEGSCLSFLTKCLLLFLCCQHFGLLV